MLNKFRNLTLVTLALMAMLVVSGCGQKGPLYLPDSDQAEESENAS